MQDTTLPSILMYANAINHPALACFLDQSPTSSQPSQCSRKEDLISSLPGMELRFAHPSDVIGLLHVPQLQQGKWALLRRIVYLPGKPGLVGTAPHRIASHRIASSACLSCCWQARGRIPRVVACAGRCQTVCPPSQARTTDGPQTSSRGHPLVDCIFSFGCPCRWTSINGAIVVLVLSFFLSASACPRYSQQPALFSASLLLHRGRRLEANRTEDPGPYPLSVSR